MNVTVEFNYPPSEDAERMIKETIEKSLCKVLSVKIEHPCEGCSIREYYARAYDMHFHGNDCLIECPIYNKWRGKKDAE